MVTSPDNGFIFREPVNADELIEQIKQRGRIVVPNKNGGLSDLLVESMEAPAEVAEIEVTAIVAARPTKNDQSTRFAVVVGSRPPSLGMPTLWLKKASDIGEWTKA